MFDTQEQIRDQLRAGEDGRAEFKEVRFGDRGVLSPNTEELAGELVAFANAEGGVVFLGVDDSGAARGIPPERWDSVEHWLLNVATHNCDPPIRPVVRKALPPDDQEGDRRILLVEVPRGLYVHRTSGGRYYTRVGSTKRDLSPPELARLRQLGPLTDDNLLIFRDRTPKGRHYTERPGDPLTGLQDSSFGAGCFGNAKSS